MGRRARSSATPAKPTPRATTMLDQVKNFLDRATANGQVVSLAGLGLAMVLFLWLLGDLLTPFLITIVIYYLLDNLTDKLLTYKILQRYSRPLLTSILMTLTLVLLTLVLIFLVPFAMEQLSQLVSNVSAEVQRQDIKQLVNEFLATLPINFPETVAADIATAVREFVYDATQYQNLLNSGVLFTLASAENLFVFSVYAIVIPICVYFLLHDKNTIIAWFRDLMPDNLTLVHTVWLRLDAKFGDYVRGKVIEIVVLTAISLAGFTILGLNYAVLLATLVGLAAVVPILGLIAVTVPVIIIAWLQWGFGELFWYLLTFYTLLQAADGYILIPLLFGEVIRLHPLAIIFGILIFGTWFGIWGVFFAIPLVILVQTILILVPEELRKASAGQT